MRIVVVTILLLTFPAGHAAAADLFEILNTLPPEVRQAVVASVEGPATFQARVRLWERKEKESNAWSAVHEQPFEAVIGRNGLAPAGEKREGDGRTPSGIFALRRAFGYSTHLPTGLAYAPVTGRDFWIDDPSSPAYNRWITQDEPPAVSHEVLRRDDDLYQFAAVVEYNTDPVIPGYGSAIFLHVWRSPQSPTAGCVAMSSAHVQSILKRLHQRNNPVLVTLTEE